MCNQSLKMCHNEQQIQYSVGPFFIEASLGQKNAHLPSLRAKVYSLAPSFRLSNVLQGRTAPGLFEKLLKEKLNTLTLHKKF